MFEKEKCYELVDVRDLFERSKAHMDELYSCRIGCIAQYICQKPYDNKSDGQCLYVQFMQDAAGNFINRRLRTSEISEIREKDGCIEVITANSIYVFQEAQLKEPEYREAGNLIELWLGTGDYLFDEGVHYDDDGLPHILQLSIHLGTVRDSFLICHMDNPGITIARYFSGYQGIEFYDTIYGQQDYDMPMLIHNTSNHPLTIKFQFCREIRYEIKPGGEKWIRPPHRKRRNKQ